MSEAFFVTAASPAIIVDKTALHVEFHPFAGLTIALYPPLFRPFTPVSMKCQQSFQRFPHISKEKHAFFVKSSLHTAAVYDKIHSRKQ